MRDRNLQHVEPRGSPDIAEHGRMAWQKASGYHWRALMEADISHFERVIGNGLRLRTDRRRAIEVAIAVDALSRMLELGRPEYVRPPVTARRDDWAATLVGPCNTVARRTLIRSSYLRANPTNMPFGISRTRSTFDSEHRGRYHGKDSELRGHSHGRSTG
jgi:hypothetical protein